MRMMTVEQDEKIDLYRRLEPGTPFFCMFSGGKDSGLALATALGMGGRLTALIHILDEKGSLYHEQDAAVIRAQAKAMNAELLYMPYKWWRGWERAEADLRAWRSFGAKEIVFGDIRLKYILLGDIPLCERSGYRACLPNGGVSYDSLMGRMEEHRIVSIITKINHPAIDRALLGQPFSREVFEYLKSLDVDPFGELDEYHTTLVDADFFPKPLEYDLVRDGRDRVSVTVRPSGKDWERWTV